MRTAIHYSALCALLCSSLACSSSDDGSGDGDGTDPAVTDPTVMDPTDPGNGQPGDPPAADNDCGISSGYLGDEFCLPAPDPSEGIQLWVGPLDYDDPAEVEPYLLEPGGEDVVCFNTEPLQNDEFLYLEQHNRMRSGSHHMLIGLKEPTGRERGRVLDEQDCQGFAGRIGTVQGSQTPESDFLLDDLAPEDMGLGRIFPADAIATFQLHYVNTREETVMREAWANLIYRDEADVTDHLNQVFLVGDISVAVDPGTRQVTPLTFSPDLTEPARIFELTGHSHAHNERFSAWKNRGTAAESLVYESYDWAEPDVLRFNTEIENPLPDPVALMDGGVSGLLYLDPGDTLDFECEVNNTTDHVLNFGNLAYEAEMCLLAGAYVGDAAGLLAGPCFGGTCGGFSGIPTATTTP